MDELICRIFRAGLLHRVLSWKDTIAFLRAKLINLQHLTRAFHVGEHYYDLGSDLYRAMLDGRMIYS